MRALASVAAGGPQQNRSVSPEKNRIAQEVKEGPPRDTSAEELKAEWIHLEDGRWIHLIEAPGITQGASESKKSDIATSGGGKPSGGTSSAGGGAVSAGGASGGAGEVGMSVCYKPGQPGACSGK
jgi:hypothetical protein